MNRPTKIAFVNLNARTDAWPMPMVPLGVMYLSSALESALGPEVEVTLFDMVIIPSEVDAHAMLADRLREWRPDLIGLRGFSCQAEAFGQVASLAKQIVPEAVVLAGGPHASTGSPSLYREPHIDLVVPGEGEETMVELVRAHRAGEPLTSVAGVGWLEDGEIRSSAPRPAIADLDAIDFPDYSLLDLDHYQGQLTMTGFLAKHRFTSLFTSRGCHYRCIYCHDNFGKRVRYRSPDDVIEEMGQLIEEQGVREFHIVDDIFNADRERALEIFDRIVRRGWKIAIAFPNGLRGDLMDEELVAAAREAGTYHWCIAIESASPRIQRLIRKNNKLDRVFESIRLADRHGIFTATFLMVGFPTETEEEMWQTIDFNVRSSAHFTHIFMATPFEGTGLFDLAREHGFEAPEGIIRYEDIHREGGRFSIVPPERIQEIIVSGYNRFVFDPHRLRRMIELTDWSHNCAHLALTLSNRMAHNGLTLETLPNAEAARVLDRLFDEARRKEPDLRQVLPPPLSGTFAAAADGDAVRP